MRSYVAWIKPTVIIRNVPERLTETGLLPVTFNPHNSKFGYIYGSYMGGETFSQMKHVDTMIR